MAQHEPSNHGADRITTPVSEALGRLRGRDYAGAEALPEHVPALREVALVGSINIVGALVSWVSIQKHTDSRLRAAGVLP